MAIWIAQSSGEVAGLVAARAAGGETEILNLAVAPSWRRHGIGRLLVDAVVEASQAEGVRRLFLEVRESNTSARIFYASLSFTELSGLKNSHFTYIVTFFGARRWTFTTGVRPIVPRMLS